MEQPIKCDMALLQLLKRVDKNHIDYLVDVLTDNGAGRVGLSSSIKGLLLDQKTEPRYSEEALRYLLQEFQEYGGHSVMNLFRNEPLPYAELLADVHRKLNGSGTDDKSDSEKEREIVLSLFGENWQALKDHERWKICTSTKVISGTFNMQERLNFDKGNVAAGAAAAIAVASRFIPALASRSLAAPIAAAITANQSVSTAYRITIPFVAHIAMLKMLDTAKRS